jgi:hypothetical protein
MIRALKTRTNADRFANDVRKHGRRYGRYIYMASVLAFALYLVNLFVGPLIWLEADGLISADRVILAPPNESQVLRMAVRTGQGVRKGEVLGEVYSAEVTKTLAGLAAQYADTQARQSEISVRVEVANAVSQALNDRLAEAENNARRVAANRPTGFVSDNFYGQAIRERALATEEKAKVEAERKSATQQLALLAKAQKEAADSMADIKHRYNGGIYLAPADGVIGSQIAHQGDVLKPGDFFADLFVGNKYVLAYLETGTLYQVKPGERVTVADGFTQTQGTLVEVLPITLQLPQEFQKAFRPRGRGQVAKITLDDETLFAHSNKVRVTGHKLIPGYDLTTADVTRAINTAWSDIRGRVTSVAEAIRAKASWIAEAHDPVRHTAEVDHP